MTNLVRYIDPETGTEVLAPQTVQGYPVPFQSRNPIIPSDMDRRLQGMVLRSEAMGVLATAAPSLVNDVGRIACDKQVKGQRVHAHGRARVTSTRPGGFFCGSSTPVDVELEVEISD